MKNSPKGKKGAKKEWKAVLDLKGYEEKKIGPLVGLFFDSH